MPGTFKFIAGPGTEGFAPIDPLVPMTNSLMIPGGVGSTVNWPEVVRTEIDRWLGSGGNGSSLTENDPIGGGLMRPEVGGQQIPVVSPQLIRRTGGRAPFIRMPNGLPGCPTGYHPEKSGEPYCVRNRRMNPLNPRALSRATRRVGGFARAVKRARTLKKICRTL